jgi:hypothetical protein
MLLPAGAEVKGFSAGTKARATRDKNEWPFLAAGSAAARDSLPGFLVSSLAPSLPSSEFVG